MSQRRQQARAEDWLRDALAESMRRVQAQAFSQHYGATVGILDEAAYNIIVEICGCTHLNDQLLKRKLVVSK